MSDPLLFSHRYGYRHRGPDPEIIVREDAPDELRYGLVKLADNLGMTPHRARDVVCGILIKQPDPNPGAPIRTSLRRSNTS